MGDDLCVKATSARQHDEIGMATWGDRPWKNLRNIQVSVVRKNIWTSQVSQVQHIQLSAPEWRILFYWQVFGRLLAGKMFSSFTRQLAAKISKNTDFWSPVHRNHQRCGIDADCCPFQPTEQQNPGEFGVRERMCGRLTQANVGKLYLGNIYKSANAEVWSNA